MSKQPRDSVDPHPLGPNSIHTDLMSNLNPRREILIDHIIFNLGSSSWMLENYLATHGKITNKMKIVNTIIL